ncbi:hypothetical protein PoB_005152900 [Plakobranchus ocellatus]|uniref:Uncharacterized protein n=1 Tax=Plakobranchus ocellatus TaxID=259542 RepID=A0AAV4BXU0_9GAST|nr:hypothetical protein PoB_005152900 [Plakobranchus ocellatus]
MKGLIESTLVLIKSKAFQVIAVSSAGLISCVTAACGNDGLASVPYRVDNVDNLILLDGVQSLRALLVAGPVDPALHDCQLSSVLKAGVSPHVKKVYERLTTDPALLGRCLLGKTQNSNESLHSVILAKFPKHTFSGLHSHFLSNGGSG